MTHSRFRFTPVTERPVTAECFLADTSSEGYYVVTTGAGWIDDHGEVAEAFSEWRASLDGVCPMRRSVMVWINGVARDVSVLAEKTTTWRAESAKEVA